MNNTQIMMNVDVEKVCRVITSFFEKLTVKQRDLIESGNPDTASKILIAELLAELLSAITNAYQALIHLKKIDINQENVLLDKTIMHIFQQALGVPEGAHSASSEKLAKLMSKEVLESVSKEKDATEPARETPPRRLNHMIRHAIEFFKLVLKKGKNIFYVHAYKSRAAKDEWDEIMNNIDSYLSGKKEKSDSLEKVVQAVLKSQTTEVLEPLLDEVKEEEFDLIQSSLKIEVIGSYVAGLIEEEVHSIKTSDKERSMNLNRAKDKIREFLTRTLARSFIHRIVAQLRAKYQNPESSKVDTQVLIVDVKTLLDNPIMSGSDRTLSTTKEEKLSFSKQLSDLIYSHVSETSDEKPSSKLMTSEKEKNIYTDICSRVRGFLSIMKWWNKIQIDDDTNDVVTAIVSNETTKKHLCGLIVEDIPVRSEDTTKREEQEKGEERVRSGEKEREEKEREEREREEREKEEKEREENDREEKQREEREREERVREERESKERVREERESKEKVLSEDREREGPYLSWHQVSGGSSERSERPNFDKMQYKMSLRIIVDKLMSRVIKDSKIPNLDWNQEMVDGVFQCIWAEFEHDDFVITTEHLQTVDKLIYRKLRRIWGKASNMLVLFRMEDRTIQKCVAASITHHLLPKRRNVFRRVLANVGQVLCFRK